MSETLEPTGEPVVPEPDVSDPGDEDQEKYDGGDIPEAPEETEVDEV